jgi:phage tail-like protein
LIRFYGSARSIGYRLGRHDLKAGIPARPHDSAGRRHPPTDTSDQGAQRMQPQDVTTAARFSITIDGYEIGTFSELTSITGAEPAGSFETPTDPAISKPPPGAFNPPTVVLKRGLTGGTELWSWLERVRKGGGASARRSCSLIAYNYQGTPVARYYLENAWPIQLDMAALKAGSSEVLVETAILECEHIQRVSP